MSRPRRSPMPTMLTALALLDAWSAASSGSRLAGSLVSEFVSVSVPPENRGPPDAGITQSSPSMKAAWVQSKSISNQKIFRRSGQGRQTSTDSQPSSQNEAEIVHTPNLEGPSTVKNSDTTPVPITLDKPGSGAPTHMGSSRIGNIQQGSEHGLLDLSVPLSTAQRGSSAASRSLSPKESQSLGPEQDSRPRQKVPISLLKIAEQMKGARHALGFHSPRDPDQPLNTEELFRPLKLPFARPDVQGSSGLSVEQKRKEAERQYSLERKGITHAQMKLTPLRPSSPQQASKKMRLVPINTPLEVVGTSEGSASRGSSLSLASGDTAASKRSGAASDRDKGSAAGSPTLKKKRRREH